MLHHIATCCLYLGFMLTNHLGVGGVIAWFHDIADIFVSLSRGLNCIGMRTAGPIAYIILMTTWIYTRNIVLPVYIYYVYTSLKHPEPSLQPLVYFEMAFLMCLQLLHIFWTFMLLKILFKLITKGE